MMRLKAVQEKVITPLRYKQKVDETNNIDSESNHDIKLFMKDVFALHQIEFVLKQVIPNLKHPNDGLIFTRNNCPYIPGILKSTVKWKPKINNTVDFFVMSVKTIISSQMCVFGLYSSNGMYGDEIVFYDCLFITDKETNLSLQSDLTLSKRNLTVECTWDENLHCNEMNVWKACRPIYGEDLAECYSNMEEFIDKIDFEE